jgi:hypothetical protein
MRPIIFATLMFGPVRRKRGLQQGSPVSAKTLSGRAKRLSTGGRREKEILVALLNVARDKGGRDYFAEIRAPRLFLF